MTKILKTEDFLKESMYSTWKEGEYKIVLGDIRYAFDRTWINTYRKPQAYIFKGKPALWTPTEYFLMGLEHDGKRFKSIQDAKDAILLNEDRTKRFLDREFTKAPLKHCVYVIYYLKSKLDEYHKDTEVVDVIPVFYKTKEDFENENNVKIDELITFDQRIEH